MGLSELQQVNAVIGLSRHIAGWPSTLADHKYILDRIELKVSIPDPSKPGVSVVVNPDLLFLSDERNQSLIVELKAGSYREHDLEQMEKLIKLTANQLVRYGRVTVSNAVTHRISVMLIVNHDNLAAFRLAVVAARHPSCLVSISTSIIQTEEGELLDNLLDREFKRGIAIAKAYMPSRLIRVLPTTNETKDLKRCVVETVRDSWVNNERFIDPQRIARQLFRNGIWDLFDSEAKARFLRTAKEVIKDMRETDFYRYIERIPGEPSNWRLLRLPDTEGNQLVKALERFQRVVRDYKTRLQNDVPYSGGRHVDQLTFEDIQ